jgi:hypothetical protein
MYVYRPSERSLYTVGHYHPSGDWISESDHESPITAARRVNYLNGGAALYEPPPDIRASLSRQSEVLGKLLMAVKPTNKSVKETIHGIAEVRAVLNLLINKQW